MTKRLLVAVCVLALGLTTGMGRAEAAPATYAGVFTGAGGAGCVSPGPCTVTGWSAVCEMARVDAPALEPCSVTLVGVINLVVNVNGLLCTGSGNATVTVRNNSGSPVASIPVTLVAAGGDMVWAGLNAGVSPVYASTSEGVIHLACGFAIGSLAGTFLAGYNV